MLETRRKLLNTTLVGILILSGALFITTLFLLETPFIGFNAFLTACLYIVYAFAAIVVLNKSSSAFSIGILVGTSFMIVVLSFQGAVYWGLVANTNIGSESASYMASVLHTIILVLQLGVTYVIIQAKEDVIDTYAAYEYIPDMGYADRASLSNASPIIQYQATIPTADI